MDERREPPDRLSKLLKGELSDDRSEAIELLANIKRRLPDLTKLLGECDDQGGGEDHVYRFYHQSWKVYSLQARTLEIVDTLREIAPKTPRQKFAWLHPRGEGGPNLNPWFLKIAEEGTGKIFKSEDNRNWAAATRPILEAFFHALVHARHFVPHFARSSSMRAAAPRTSDSSQKPAHFLR